MKAGKDCQNSQYLASPAALAIRVVGRPDHEREERIGHSAKKRQAARGSSLGVLTALTGEGQGPGCGINLRTGNAILWWTPPAPRGQSAGRTKSKVESSGVRVN